MSVPAVFSSLRAWRLIRLWRLQKFEPVNSTFFSLSLSAHHSFFSSQTMDTQLACCNGARAHTLDLFLSTQSVSFSYEEEVFVFWPAAKAFQTAWGLNHWIKSWVQMTPTMQGGKLDFRGTKTSPTCPARHLACSHEEDDPAERWWQFFRLMYELLAKNKNVNKIDQPLKKIFLIQ